MAKSDCVWDVISVRQVGSFMDILQVDCLFYCLLMQGLIMGGRCHVGLVDVVIWESWLVPVCHKLV